MKKEKQTSVIQRFSEWYYRVYFKKANSKQGILIGLGIAVAFVAIAFLL